MRTALQPQPPRTRRPHPSHPPRTRPPSATRALAGLLSLCAAAAAVRADPLVMGPTPITGGTNTAFDASNTVNQLSQNNTNFVQPPLVWTENLIAGGPTSQTTSNTWGNGSYALASCITAHALSTSPLSTTLFGQIQNQRILEPAFDVDPPDSLFAYAGASLFFTFTITQTAGITMSWNTTFGGPAPMQTVMFWDIVGSNPALGSVASSSGIDSGLWTGTFAPGEYAMIYTRHDGNTASASTNANSATLFQLTATIPAPGAAALLALGGVIAGGRGRRKR